MKAEGCREWRERIGALVLGQLSEDERFATEAHLDGCPACRAEVEALAPVASLLERVDPERLAPTPAPPPGARRADHPAHRGRAPHRTPAADPPPAWPGGRGCRGRGGRRRRRRGHGGLGPEHPLPDGRLPIAAARHLRRGHPRAPPLGERGQRQGVRLSDRHPVPGVAPPLRRQASARRVVSLRIRRRGRAPQLRPGARRCHRDRPAGRLQDLRCPPAPPRSAGAAS